MSTREDYIDGKLFSVGDIVINTKRETIHEVVGLGTNYVTTVGVDGELSRHWIDQLMKAESIRKDFVSARRRRSSSNQIAYRGYKTEHLTEAMYDQYYPIIKKHNDPQVVVNFLMALDEAMEILGGYIDESMLVHLNKSVDVVSKFAARMGTDASLLEQCRNMCNEELRKG